MNNLDDMIQTVCELIKIPSVSDENKVEEGMPFGKDCDKALKYALDLGNKMGFRTKNVDGYCGYIEFGEGKELLGIIGHLDVVPADEADWTVTNPFEPKVVDGKIYGRGAIDDKGPVTAALYAMKEVKDTVKLNKRVRLILGLNEEKEWKCINYYRKNEEYPSIGFSPDADFPCIYAEKGIINVFIEAPLNNQEKIIIKNIDYKNNAMNVVPKYCDCELEVADNTIQKRVIDIINEITEKNKSKVEIEKIDETHIKIISYGISAHAAHPESGENAITTILQILGKIYQELELENQLLEFFGKYLNTDYNGNLLDINKKDESGELTLNIARLILNKEEQTIKIGMNLRIPVNTPIDFIEEKFLEKQEKFQALKISFANKMKPLYIPKDSKLVTTLTNIFNEITGKNEEPITIGGATYARAFPNCVSFGANLPGQKDLCHQADEFISIDNLILSAKIYAEAMRHLGQS